jgi:hypothetical protein
MRWFIAVTVLLGTLTGLGAAANGRFSLDGQLSANDQELQEGYFAINQNAMLVARPGTELHVYLKSMIGRKVRITVEPLPGIAEESD